MHEELQAHADIRLHPRKLEGDLQPTPIHFCSSDNPEATEEIMGGG